MQEVMLAASPSSVQALLDQFWSVECWCGWSFSMVVARYLEASVRPSIWQRAYPRDDESRAFPALEALVAVPPLERRRSLVAELSSLLALPTSDARKAAFLAFEGAEALLDYGDFLYDETLPFPEDEDDVTTFLRHTLHAAQTFVPSPAIAGVDWDAYRAERESAALAESQSP